MELGGGVMTRSRRIPAWLGLLPFFLIAFGFLVWPAYSVVLQAFVDSAGAFTLENLSAIFQAQYRDAFQTTAALAFITAGIGAIAGTIMTYAVSVLQRPRFLKSAMATFSGVASQFGGVPLAFAFVATIGSAGLITTWLDDIGFDLYGTGFSLLSFWGLVIVYLYFQIPLMMIMMSPAIEGMRAAWSEAAENLGASRWQYWRYVGIPLLTPAILGAFVLLFANAFSAYATAEVLTSGTVNLVPIQIGFFVQGNVFAANSQIGYALALGMIFVVSAALALNLWLQRRVARWAQ